MKLYYLLLVFLFILVSCGTKNDNIDGKSKATLPVTSNSGANSNKLNVNNKNYLLETEVKDKEKIKNVLKNDNNFYLFSDSIENLNKQKLDIEKSIQTLNNGNILKKDPNGKDFTEESYKKYKLEEIDNITLDNEGKGVNNGKIKRIDYEIKSIKENLHSLNLKSFLVTNIFDGITGEVKKVEISKDEANKKMNEAKIFLTKTLENTEKVSIALNNKSSIKQFIYEEQETVNNLIQSKKEELIQISDKIKKNEEINNIKKVYIEELKKNKSKFNIKEITYIVENVLKDQNIKETNFVFLSKKEIENTIKLFETGKLINITKQINGGLSISSNTLYLKSKTIKGKEFYIDEKFYKKAKNSSTYGYDSFIVYTLDSEKNYNLPIYNFLTGYEKDKSYFIKLIEVITENINNDIFIGLTKNGKTDIISDINDKGIIINLFKYINGEISTNDIEKGKYLDLLKYIM